MDNLDQEKLNRIFSDPKKAVDLLNYFIGSYGFLKQEAGNLLPKLETNRDRDARNIGIILKSFFEVVDSYLPYERPTITDSK